MKEVPEFPKDLVPLKLDNGKFVKVVTRSTLPGPQIPSYGVQIHLAYAEDSLKVILEDSCHEVLLPQRAYVYGKGEKEWKWDTLNRMILVDKNLVTNQDILEWNPSYPFKKFSYPAINLTLKEMERFCAFRGKTLIQTHIFDASTFLPSEGIEFKSFQSPYPWTKIKTESFLWKANHYSDFVFDKKYCLKAYTFECLAKMPYYDFQYKSSSWLGLANVLGGPMQAMKNPLEPRENLFVPSFNFLASSKLQQLGKRNFWDGLGSSWDHFALEEKPHLQKASVGFRCMRFIPDAI
jgi:hypothetical protein